MEGISSTGSVMSTIGLGAVFFALALLIGVIAVASRLIGRTGAGGAKGPAAGATGATASAGVASSGGGSSSSAQATGAAAAKDSLLHVALAAYALHRRRSVAVRAPAPPSPWGVASRVAQLRGGPG